MKRLFAILLLCVGTLTTALSAPIDASRALERVRGAQGAARYTSAPLTLVYSGGETASPAYYVFASEGHPGYVIAGGDDLASPVLGYADSGTFDYSALPDQMRSWLDFYAREIEWARKQPRSSVPPRSTGRPDRAPVTMMVHAHWDQGAPYNNKTPILNGSHTATGCVATAIAQIMRYWQYPDVGKGSRSYTWETGNKTLSMNFSQVRFDWANMPFIHTDTWTSAQDDAVATLMQSVGYAMDMDYNLASAGGSGAVTAYATERLINYFGYAPSSTHYDRDNFGLYDWEDLVYGSLVAGCPVLYHGTGSAGGHAFVVDGYQSDGYFHLNWGWGGSSNGYFLLTALDPANLGIGGGAGGFNTNQGAAINLRPDFTGSKPEYSISADNGYTMSLSGNTLTLSGGFWNYCGQTIPTVYYGLLIENETGYVGARTYTSFSNLGQYYGLRSYSVTLQSGMADGTYILNPAYGLPDGNYIDYHKMLSMDVDRYVLTVSGGNYSLARLSDAEIEATGLSVGPRLYIGSKCSLRATLSNPGATELYKDVYLAWYSTSGSFLGVGDAMLTDLPAGASLEWDKPITVPSRVKKTSTSTYILTAPNSFKVALAVYNSATSAYERISDYADVSLLSGSPSASLSCSDLVVNNASSVHAMDVALDFTLRCTSGYFANNIYAFVLDADGNQKQYFLTPECFLASGESKRVQFRFPFPAGEAGKTYMALLNYRPSPSSSLSYLGSANFTIGTTGVESVEAGGKPGLFIDGQAAHVVGEADITGVEVYDLQGVRRQADVAIDGPQATVALDALVPGVYLLRVATATGTHTLRLLRK